MAPRQPGTCRYGSPPAPFRRLPLGEDPLFPRSFPGSLAGDSTAIADGERSPSVPTFTIGIDHRPPDHSRQRQIQESWSWFWRARFERREGGEFEVEGRAVTVGVAEDETLIYLPGRAGHGRGGGGLYILHAFVSCHWGAGRRAEVEGP